jgi:Kdo2-lipid IVA lauroyltransferase/acyltransferase
VIVKALKSNEIVWYSTDQNFGNKKGIFAPFFGTQASTITAISKFSKMTGATVIPFTHKRTHNGKGIELQLHPEFKNFPAESPEQDAKRINQFLENYLIENPANYLWLHQRFRTMPPGEPAIYTKQ